MAYDTISVIAFGVFGILILLRVLVFILQTVRSIAGLKRDISASWRQKRIRKQQKSLEGKSSGCEAELYEDPDIDTEEEEDLAYVDEYSFPDVTAYDYQDPEDFLPETDTDEEDGRSPEERPAEPEAASPDENQDGPEESKGPSAIEKIEQYHEKKRKRA